MAAATPLTVVMWCEPYEQTDFGLNSAVTVRIALIDRTSKLPADPDTLNAFYSAPLASTTTGLSAVKDAVGLYHVDLALTLVGRWVITCQPIAGGAQVGAASTTLSVMDLAA